MRSQQLQPPLGLPELFSGWKGLALRHCLFVHSRSLTLPGGKKITCFRGPLLALVSGDLALGSDASVRFSGGSGNLPQGNSPPWFRFWSQHIGVSENRDRFSSDLLWFTGVSEKNLWSTCHSIKKQSDWVSKTPAIGSLFRLSTFLHLLSFAWFSLRGWVCPWDVSLF